MRLPKPREELVEIIAASLVDKPIPVRMIEWRHKDWLQAQDDNTLLRCYVETNEFRLNPNNSKEFLEEGISRAERSARLIEFVLSLPSGEVARLAIDAIERLFVASDQLASADEGIRTNWDLAMVLADLAKRIDDQRKDEPRKRGSVGGTKTAAHWQAVAAEAVRIAQELGLSNGEYSAEYVAGEIRDRVRAFARQNGRDFPSDPTRKIANYLRKAGIKKSRRTP